MEKSRMKKIPFILFTLGCLGAIIFTMGEHVSAEEYDNNDALMTAKGFEIPEIPESELPDVEKRCQALGGKKEKQYLLLIGNIEKAVWKNISIPCDCWGSSSCGCSKPHQKNLRITFANINLDRNPKKISLGSAEIDNEKVPQISFLHNRTYVFCAEKKPNPYPGTITFYKLPSLQEILLLKE